MYWNSAIIEDGVLNNLCLTETYDVLKYFYFCASIFTNMFNRNIWCIEIFYTVIITNLLALFNRNIWCIEISKVYADLKKQDCLTETYDVLK